MPRFIYGPVQAFTEPPPSTPKNDPVVAFGSISPGGNVVVTAPAFDPATTNTPVNIHAVYMTDQHPNFGSLQPTPQNLLALGFAQGHATYSLNGSAGNVSISVPGVVAGTPYWVQLVVEFAS